MDSEAVLESRNLRQSSQMDSWQTVFVFRDLCVERVDTPALEMLLETYPSETDKPADRAAVVQERPMELDRAQAKKERKRARDKAYRNVNAVHLKEYQKKYQKKYNADAANIERNRAKKKAWDEANADHLKEYQKRYRKKYNADAANIERKKEWYKQWRVDAANIEKQKAYWQKRYASKPEQCKAATRAWKLRNYGCIKCIKWPVDQQLGLPHYDGYCFRCFCDEFPHDERVKNRGRVELRVRVYLNSHFAGFVHDHQMPTAHCVCDHRRRIDHRREVGNTLLCIETDEHHHRYYDKDDEDARYHDMLMGWGGKLCFVRFNPDGVGPPLEDRLKRLHAEITRHIGRLERGENSAFLEVWHLYYPEGTEDYCGDAIAPEGCTTLKEDDPNVDSTREFTKNTIDGYGRQKILEYQDNGVLSHLQIHESTRPIVNLYIKKTPAVVKEDEKIELRVFQAHIPGIDDTHSWREERKITIQKSANSNSMFEQIGICVPYDV